MKYHELPRSIVSPITNDVLELRGKDDHNDFALSVAQFFDECTECFDSEVAMYQNDDTGETMYVSIDEN